MEDPINYFVRCDVKFPNFFRKDVRIFVSNLLILIHLVQLNVLNYLRRKPKWACGLSVQLIRKVFSGSHFSDQGYIDSCTSMPILRMGCCAYSVFVSQVHSGF